MARTLLTTSRGNLGATGISTAGGIQYWWLGNATLVSSTIEAARAVPYRVTGNISKLYIRIIANSTTADSTITVRKNSTNTSLTITIPAGASGIGVFEDTSNSVPLTAGDLLGYQTISGGTGTFTIALVSVQLSITSSAIAISKEIMQAYSISTASVTHYLPISGNRSGTSTSEANTESTVKIAGTIKNASLYVFSNARTTNTVITLRKNRANTAITFTYGNIETGLKQDTTNSVSVAVDDEVDWSITTSTGTEAMTLQYVALEFENSARYGFINAASVGGTADITLTPSVTEYYAVAGSMIEATTTEADAQLKPRATYTLSKLTVLAGANTITADSTVRIRINGVNGNQVCTINASTAAFVTDTTHTDTVTPNDLIDYQIITGASGTLLTIRQLAVWTLGGIDTELPASDSTTISEPSMIRRLARSRSSGPETVDISETRNRVNGAVRAIAAQVVAIGEDLDAVVMAVGGAVDKIITETATTISEGINRLKAVWRYQP